MAGNCVHNDDEAQMFTDMGLPVFSFSPLGAGLFAGNFIKLKKYAVTDEGILRAYFNDENRKKFERAGHVAFRRGTDVPSVALSYITSQNLLIAPIIGPKTPDECRACLDAARLRLSIPELDYLSLRRNGI